jgi:hypothetical protein
MRLNPTVAIKARDEPNKILFAFLVLQRRARSIAQMPIKAELFMAWPLGKEYPVMVISLCAVGLGAANATFSIVLTREDAVSVISAGKPTVSLVGGNIKSADTIAKKEYQSPRRDMLTMIIVNMFDSEDWTKRETIKSKP